MATDAELVEKVRHWFAEKGLDLIVEWKDLPTHGGKGYWVDVASLRSGKVFAPCYGVGPSETLAVIATEQRYLVEQEGCGSMPGKTYIDKAEERLRCNRML